MKTGKRLNRLSIALLTVGALVVLSTDSSAQILGRPPGLPTRIDPESFVDITAGDAHTCARKWNGNVYCWGKDSSVQAGQPSGSPAVSMCGTTACVKQPTYVMTAVQIDSGMDHSCALRPGGAAVCWGDNTYGALGNGYIGTPAPPTDVVGPANAPPLVFSSVSAGVQSTCGTTSSGMYCWGFIASTTSASAPRPTLLSSFNGYNNVTLGQAHGCALDPWGEVDCWGANGFGQTGVDPSTFGPNVSPYVYVPFTVRSSLGNAAVRVTTQSDYTCADQKSGIVQCVGQNYWGQLGSGAISYSATYAAQTVGGGMALHGVTTSLTHGCALDPSGAAYCWGNGDWGQLGNNVISSQAQGIHPSPERVVGGLSFRAIASGTRHTCAIGTNNHIYCWGQNTYGQLGTTALTGGWFSTPQQAMDP
jgi:alpha-tubulin suppressor-like RCC1 family protein